MTKKFLVAPSILSADFANLEREISSVTQAGADWIHVDVMDGHFVPNLTIGAPVVKALKRVAKIPLDVHLMISQPEKYLAEFVEAGADYLTIHVEATENPLQVVNRIRELGAKPGITLKPQTPVSAIIPLLPFVDLVLVMTVNPGFGGQSFMRDQAEKVTFLARQRQQEKLSYLIEVDGGITRETAMFVKDADVLVAGNFVFKNQNYAEAIQSLKESKKENK